MVTIAPIAAADVPEVQRCASDERVQRTTNLPSPYPADGAATWFARIEANRHSGRQYVFAIRDGGEFAGIVTLNNLDLDRRSAQLDYWVAAPSWGKGVGTAAAQLALLFAKERLGLTRMFSSCLTGNHGSRRVLEKCGFAQTGSTAYAGPFSVRYGGREMFTYEREL